MNRKNRNLLIPFLLLIALFFVSITGPALTIQSVEDSLKRAEKLYQERKYEESIAVCDRAIAENPRNAALLFRRGIAYYRLRKYGPAMADFDKAIALDPKNNKAYNGRANVLFDLKRYPESIQNSDASLRLDPGYVSAFITRALCKRQLKDASGALADLNRALKLDPKSVTALINRGLIKYDSGDNTGAVADYDLALALAPQNTTALLTRSRARRKLKNLDGAIADADRLIELDPKNADAFANRGLYLLEKGELEAARRDLNEALRIDPKHKRAPRNLARLEEQARQGAAQPGRSAPAGTVPGPAAGGAPSLPAGARTSAARTEFDTRDMTAGTWTGSVSAAMEAMRVVVGPMTAEETAKFESGWAPMFREPYPEAVAWLERLTPLLARFLAIRAGMARAADAFDGAWSEAMGSAAIHDEGGVREALSVAWGEKLELEALSADLAAVVKDIAALGDPPNPVAIGRKHRKDHEEVLKATKKAVEEAAGPAPAAEGNAAYVLVKRWTERFEPAMPGVKQTVTWKSGGASSEERNVAGEKEGLIQIGKFEHAWTEPPTRFRPSVFDSKKPVGKDLLQKGDDVTLEISIRDAGSTVSADTSKHKQARAVVAAVTMIEVKDALDTRGRAMVNAGKSTDGDDDVLQAKSSLRLLANVQVPLKERQQRIQVIVTVNGGALHYEYAFDASGTSIEPLSSEGGGAPRDGTAEQDPRAALADRIAEHEEMIELIRRNMEADKRDLAKATGDRREALVRRLLYADADIQAEKDFIQSLKTGKAVHTRTALDAAFHARFVENTLGEVREFAERDRLRNGVYRMAARATTPGEAESLRDFVRRNTDAKSDASQLRKVAGIVFDKVMAPLESEVAKAEEDLAWHDYKVKFATDLKKTTDRQMMVLSLFGGHHWMVAYQAATGFIEGPPPSGDPDSPKDPTLGRRIVESVKRGATWYSTATFVAAEAFEGYEKGGYLGGPQTKGTAWGAVERAGEALLMAKLIEYGAGKIFGVKPGTVADVKKLTLRERIDVLKYKQELEHGASLVDDYARSFTEYRNAMTHGASGGEAKALEEALRRKAASIHSSLEAKLVMKARGAAGKGTDAIEDYVFRMGQNHAAVEREFPAAMKGKGYENPESWALQDFRNSASAGTTPMDHDVGLLDKGLTYRKDGMRVSLPTLNEDAQNAWNEVYRKVTGYSATRSFETFTTKFHKEAYRDLAWLGDKTVRHVKVDQISGKWAGQAADVTAIKAQDMLAGQGGLTRLQGMSEAGRGMAKDVETKLLPVLERALAKAPSESKRLGGLVDYWREIGQLLGTAPKNPMNVDRLLRLKSGGKGFTEIVNDLRDMIAAFGKAAGK